MESLTRATLRIAELGFFGFVVKILLQTPLTKGLDSRAGTLLTGGRWAFRAPRRFCCKVTAHGCDVEKDRMEDAAAVEGRRDGPATALRKSEDTQFQDIVMSGVVVMIKVMMIKEMMSNEMQV